MSSKSRNSIDEERRQADVTARALGEVERPFDESVDDALSRDLEDTRELARELSTALIEPAREPSADLRDKIQQHFAQQNSAHARRHAVNTKARKQSSSKKNWFALAGCALVAATVGLYSWDEHRSGQSHRAVMNGPRVEQAEAIHQPSQSQVDQALDVLTASPADQDPEAVVVRDTQEELAQLVGEFNELLHDNRVQEAQVKASEAIALDPRNPVAETMKWKAAFAQRLVNGQGIGPLPEHESYGQYESVVEASTNFDDRAPVRFPDVAEWKALSQQRAAAVYPTGSSGILGQTKENVERYEPVVENEFRSPAETQFAKSTFSIDVDTASYANVRRYLNQNSLPPTDAVRIEELINYFNYDYPQPKDGKPFSVSTEVAECPWHAGHHLVRIGLKGKEIESQKRRPCNLVFLIDVSGSMADEDKLPLLKRGLQMMLAKLTEADRVTIVTYASDAGLALDATSGDQTRKLAAAIDALGADGSTNGGAGIQMAYQKAQENFIKHGNNRVILATDGDLNVGVTDNQQLVNLIRENAAAGTFLTVLGFGTGNLNDSTLEYLADNGNGIYGYVDSMREARKLLVEQATGSLVTIAKDVKIQVEFNPAEVASYRLIGYENRALTNADFNNDKRDAGDIGAGHTVTALYEVVLVKQAERPLVDSSEPLKYQRTPKPVVRASFTDAAKNGELLTVWLRYKEPNADESQKLEYAVKNSTKPFNRASKDLQFAAAVVSFGMLLRNSEQSGAASFESIEEIAAGSLGNDPRGYRTEFLDLVRKARALQPTRASSYYRR